MTEFVVIRDVTTARNFCLKVFIPIRRYAPQNESSASLSKTNPTEDSTIVSEQLPPQGNLSWSQSFGNYQGLTQTKNL